MSYNVKNKFAIVVSQFNADITSQLRSSAITRLTQLGFDESNYAIIEVPGAVEVPFAAQCCAQAGAKAIVTFGLVIRGETNHYDYVCQQVSDGCQQVMLKHNLPVVFGVLTTNNKQQAQDRVDGTIYDVGSDSIDTMLTMLSLSQEIVP